MIPRTELSWQSQSWQEQLINIIRDPKELCRELAIDVDALKGSYPALCKANDDFQVRVPRSYLQRIERGNLNDPLLLQVLPSAAELINAPGYVTDPLAEAAATQAPGIIQKYHGRALLMLTSACAIHCRYCFRRHFPYENHRQSRHEWQESLDRIARDTSLNEIILSGGDPLTLADAYLAEFVEHLEAISHIKTLRIHTRLPIVIPDRVNPELLTWLRRGRLNKVMVLHANHANEINNCVRSACRSLRDAGVTLLNQAVLLRGINNSVSSLATLSHRLFESGVLPYYLHVLDKVQGVQHFDLPRPEALKLHKQLQTQLPGYLVPRLSHELAGAPNKIILS
ncbi:EF-P beta-lysylation protein EpmB [Aurantivibrio plasticivorans]